MNKLTKRQVRYWCFRFRTQYEGGVTADGAPIGLMAHFESLEWFSSWKEFSLTWDVKEDFPLEIKRLKENAEEEWKKVVEKNAKTLPVKKINPQFDRADYFPDKKKRKSKK